MALKDITLGQYFPGDTPIHRLDPRTKILLTIFYIVALFMADFLLTYTLVFLALVTGIALSRIPPKTILRGMKPVVFVVIITAILNLFYTPGVPIVQFWIFQITVEGIWAAFFMVVRILMLITGTFLLTYTTSPILLTDGIESLLSPLKKIRVPVHELAMMMSIALRFIPTLIEETDKIMNAQKARGAQLDTGKMTDRVKALVPVLIPLFISAFRRADELAMAMECRCYRGGDGRTRLKVLRCEKQDYIDLAVCIACFAVILASRLMFPNF